MTAVLTFSSNKFSYSAQTQTFATEASDLEGRFNGGSFYILSAKTGVRKLFLFDRAETDAEGDVVAWHYFMPAGGLRAVVFND